MTNSKPFWVHTELQGMKLTRLCPFQSQKIPFSLCHKCLVYKSYKQVYKSSLFGQLTDQRHYFLAHSLALHFHVTWHFSERRCASVFDIVLFVSIFPASYCVYSVSFPACVYTALAGVDDCWGRVYNGGSFHYSTVSMATIENSKGARARTHTQRTRPCEV